MKNNIFLKFIFMAVVVLFLCGCIYSKEKRDEKDEITADAIQYIEKKYDKKFEVEESSYVLLDSTLFGSYSDDIEIALTDGTKILYSAKQDKFYDDYQREEISKDLENEIWNPMIEKLQPFYYRNTTNVIKPSFNLYDEEGLTGNFFNNYYNGDIDNFVKKEELSVTLGYYNEYDNFTESEIYIISNDSESWKERFNIVENTLDTYFKGQLDYQIQLVALTQELYENSVKHRDVPNVNIGMDGCWAKSFNKKLNVQKYIKVSDGVYITSNTPSIILEEGDITFKEVMTATELQEIIEKVVKKQESTSEHYNEYEKYKYYVNSLTPIYELEFSQRVQDKFKEYGDDATLSVYIKFVPEELNISNDNNLYSYPIRNGKMTYYENYIVAKGNEDIAEYENLYIFKKDNKDYYWIGTQILEEIEKEESTV